MGQKGHSSIVVLKYNDLETTKQGDSRPVYAGNKGKVRVETGKTGELLLQRLSRRSLYYTPEGPTSIQQQIGSTSTTFP